MSAADQALQRLRCAHCLDLEHSQDSECTVDPATDLCTGCGVYHGSPCPWCDGRGFHNAGCELLKD